MSFQREHIEVTDFYLLETVKKSVLSSSIIQYFGEVTRLLKDRVMKNFYNSVIGSVERTGDFRST